MIEMSIADQITNYLTLISESPSKYWRVKQLATLPVLAPLRHGGWLVWWRAQPPSWPFPWPGQQECILNGV